MLAVARLARNYALRVHSDPLAGCGPCGRPPLQGNQFPIRGADGHKGEAAAKLNCLVIFHPVYYYFQISRIYVVIFLHMSLFFCTFIA